MTQRAFAILFASALLLLLQGCSQLPPLHYGAEAGDGAKPICIEHMRGACPLDSRPAN
ncbi:hypothetical protein [Acidihalobacter prosperus]|uniref:Lipoprotein n=1 Tax=Acidihalobacter prosperus TaxID=160660 RepID=A0A1A6C6B7_9GAMM|nr:hypothetical protein [Acidihalobacter prosperus]OBS10106.1 hypothetical protein Thpro_021156 [Acidihalobacter prosperus]